MNRPILIILYSIALLIGFKAQAQKPDFLFECLSPVPFQYVDYNAPVNFFYGQDFPGVCPLEIPSHVGTDGRYLIAVSENRSRTYFVTDSLPSQPIIYKLSPNGEILDELVVGDENCFSQVYTIMRDPNDDFTCLALGTTYDHDLQYTRPLIIKFDYDLNLQWQKEIDLPEPYRCGIAFRSAIDVEREFLCCYNYYDFGSFAPDNGHALYCRFTSDGELAGLYEHPTPIRQSGELFRCLDGSGDIGQVVEEYTDSLKFKYCVLQLNKDLELVNRLALPDYLGHFNLGYTLKMTSLSIGYSTADGCVLYGGNASFNRYTPNLGSSVHNYVIGFIKVDSEGDFVTFGSAGLGESWEDCDTIRQSVGIKVSDASGDNAFVFCYMVGERNGWGNDWVNYLVVEKKDFDGRTLWKRFWNHYYTEDDPRAYFATHIVGTSDGGCLVGGFSYHSCVNDVMELNIDMEPNIFLLKVFADGTLSTPETEMGIRPYAFYPNPVGDCLDIQFSPDVTPTLVELYDAQGRLVTRQTASLESVNTTGLKAGLYTVKVTLSDGKTYSDTVIKQ